MVVDNPFNHHNVNHLKHRFIIVQQIKRYSGLSVPLELVMKLSKFRTMEGPVIPYPMIAPWRRQKQYVDLDQLESTEYFAKDFNEFVDGVSSLYKSAATGGLDSRIGSLHRPMTYRSLQRDT